MNNTKLKYKDEYDRAIGLAGMAIALYACDGEQFLASVSVDLPTGEGIKLTPDFGYDSNPALSAKFVWKQLLHRYELSAAMILGNAMCRSYIGQGKRFDSSTDSLLRDIINDEGKSICDLEYDETRSIYNKTHQFLDRIFTHSTVASTAQEFADMLCRQRTLCSTEILALLSTLGR